MVCSLPPPVWATQKDNPYPFANGEELTYTIRWEMVTAGKAVLRVLPDEMHGNLKRRHFELNAKSNRYVDRIYKVRDQMDGYADFDLTRSVLYKKKQSGKERRRVKVDFDWDQKTVAYTGFGKNNRVGKKRKPLSVPDQTFDPVSAIYKMRTIDFQRGQTLSFSVTDGKKWFTQYAHVKERQVIQLPSGAYDTYLIIPEVTHLSGVFKKSKNPTVKVWVTADEKKIPVRIKVKVFIGSVICDLVSVNKK